MSLKPAYINTPGTKTMNKGLFLTSVAMLPREREMPVPVLKRVHGNKRLRSGINGEGAGPETI